MGNSNNQSIDSAPTIYNEIDLFTYEFLADTIYTNNPIVSHKINDDFIFFVY